MKKVFFNDEQLSSAAELAKQLRAEAKPELTEVENMERSIQMRLQDVDAMEIAQELCRGIQKFHALYKRASANSLSDVVNTELDGILSGMDEQEQKELLTKILGGFAASTGNELPDGDYELEVMREAVQIYLCEYSVVNLLDCDALPEDLDPETARRLLEAYDQTSLEGYTAVAMYLLQVTGEVEQIPAELTPAQIGSMTAASLKVNKSILAHFLGDINFEEFKKTLKLIAGVAAMALLAAVAWQAAKFAYTLAAVGMGVLLAKAGIVNTVFVKLAGWMAGSEVLSEVREYAKAIALKTGVGQAAATVWTGIKEYYEKLIPSVKTFWSNLRSRLGVVLKQKETVEEPVFEDTVEEEAEEIRLC